MIDIDLTVVIQFVNFLITLVVLNWLLIRPVREQIAKRRSTLADLKSSAEALNARAEDALANYQSAMDNARKEGAGICADARNAAEAEGLVITNKASGEAREIVHTAAEAAAVAVAESRAVLRTKLPQLTQETIDRLTGSAAKTA